MAKGFNDIEPGDKVTIMAYAGMSLKGAEYKPRTGKAVIVTRANPYDHESPVTHVTLNMGGRYGMPAVATPDNFVKATG